MIKKAILTVLTLVLFCSCDNHRKTYRLECEVFNYANLTINNSRQKNFDVYIDDEYVGQVRKNSTTVFRIKSNKNVEIKVKQSQGNILKTKMRIKTINIPSCSNYVFEIESIL